MGIIIKYIAKVFVQQLHVAVNNLQGYQLIFPVLYGQAEIQACIPEEKTTQW